MMLEGLDVLFAYIVNMVTDGRQTSSLAVTIHYLLEDVANAVDYATTHYFPLSLDEPFLQSSGFGSPYRKWAKFTNDDFEDVERCLRRLIPAVWQWYQQTTDQSSCEEWAADKVAWGWLNGLFDEYISIEIDPDEPTIALTAISMTNWVNPLNHRFLNVWNFSPEQRPQRLPDALTTVCVNIADRSKVVELHQQGRQRLLELRNQTSRLSKWLQDNYTMAELIAPHQGTLSNGSFHQRGLKKRRPT